MFALDASISETCFFLDITRQTFYNWKKKYPVKFDKLERLREKPVLLARQAAIKHSTANYANAMDYLSRKRSAEFGNKAKIEHDITVNHKEEARKRTAAFRERISELDAGIGSNT